MNANELLDAIGEVRGEYIWQAQKYRAGQAAAKRIPLRKILLIAATIALAALLVGCTVAYVLRLQDMKIGEYSVTRNAHYSPGWERIEATQITYDRLSLQGLGDSPSQNALVEWLAFREGYRDTGSSETQPEIPDAYYHTYGCSNREMAERLDEIAGKYGLKLLGQALYFQNGQYGLLFDTLKIPGICREAGDAEIEYGSGYCYPEGTFRLYFDVTLTGDGGAWPYKVGASIRYSRKDCFDPAYIGVRDVNSFRQWEKTLDGGARALLAMNGEDVVIAVDREDAFITVRFNSRRGIDTMTPETVERIAGLLDFSIQPQALSEREEADIRARLDALEEQELKEYRKRQEEYEKDAHKDGYDGWVKQTLEEYAADVSELGYAFFDIDGNGTQELLIGRDGYPTAVYIERDGKTELLNNAYFYMYPCEDHKLAGVMGLDREAEYYLGQFSDGGYRVRAHIGYFPGCPEGEYWRYDIGAFNQHDYISREEFDDILKDFPRVPVPFQPLAEYPLEAPETIPAQPVYTYEEPYGSYGEKIRERLTDREENWGRWAYDLQDLDGNGQKELIWREDTRYFIYTILDHKVCFYKMWGDGVTVCQDGYVEAVARYGPVNKSYRYYRVDGSRMTLVEYLRYDTDADPENPWFQSPDLSCQDATLRPISKETFDAIRARYVPLELDMKPLMEYIQGEI